MTIINQTEMVVEKLKSNLYLITIVPFIEVK